SGRPPRSVCLSALLTSSTSSRAPSDAPSHEPYARGRLSAEAGNCVTGSAHIRSRAAVFGNGMFRLLFTATLGSAIGTYATTIALTADIDARTHSTWWVALLFLVTFMPKIFVGLFVGP